MDKLRYAYWRVGRAADYGARNLDTQQQALEAVGIRPKLIYPDVASGGSLDRHGWRDLVTSVRQGDTIVVRHLVRIGRNVQAIGRLTSTTVADLTGGVCNGIAGLWLGGAVSTATRTG